MGSIPPIWGFKPIFTQEPRELDQLPSGKDSRFPWKGQVDGVWKGGSWPLAGRVITLLLLLNFTTWAVVLTLGLVLGCPINLAFGGFPRWGGRSYLGSVERGV